MVALSCISRLEKTCVANEKLCHWKRFLTIGASLTVSALMNCNLGAQTAQNEGVVQVAHEFDWSRATGPIPTELVQAAAEQQQNPSMETKQEVEQPESAVGSTVENGRSNTKRTLNFIPPQRPIGQVNIDLKSKPKGETNLVPEDFAQSAFGDVPVVQAASSEEMVGGFGFIINRRHDEVFAYQPLYFEEANLERYGRNCGPLQPAVSGVRFFGTIASLPYAMAVHHPNQAYTFKWPYDAGWGAPKVKELRPLELKPAAIQAGVVTGLFFVVP